MAGSEGLGRISLILLGFPLALLEEPLLRMAPSSIRIFLDHSMTAVLTVVFIINSIQWFLIGSVLGWLYGKIKNRNKI